jgi:hypothetical protein
MTQPVPKIETLCQQLRSCFKNVASAGRAKRTAARNPGVHEELLVPSMGLAPDGASLPLFEIVPDDFVEPARHAAMLSAVVFETASYNKSFLQQAV